jgi:hypothetical protein
MARERRMRVFVEKLGTPPMQTERRSGPRLDTPDLGGRKDENVKCATLGGGGRSVTAETQTTAQVGICANHRVSTLCFPANDRRSIFHGTLLFGTWRNTFEIERTTKSFGMFSIKCQVHMAVPCARQRIVDEPYKQSVPFFGYSNEGRSIHELKDCDREMVYEKRDAP